MKENQFQDIELKTKEIFEKSFVKVVQIDNSDLRHIYIRKQVTGEELLAVSNLYKILFISQVYDEENKDQKMDAYQVLVVSELEVDEETLTVAEILKNASSETLFCLFKEYENKLIEKNEDTGIFCVDEDVAISEDKPIFTDSDRREIVKDMKL